MADYKEIARTLIKAGENCVLIGYLDVGGVPTNGYGNTGPGVKAGVGITQAQADYDLDRNLEIADSHLRACVKPAAFGALTEHEKAALLSFVFNLGANPKWTVWQDINSGNLADVPTQFRRFDKARIGGKLVVVPGLDNRREAEVRVWNTGDMATATAILAASPVASVSSAVTRTLETPPTPAAPKALAKTSLAIKVATVVSGAGAYAAKYLPDVADKAGQAHNIIAPHVAEHPWFGAAAASRSAVVVCCGVAALFVHADQQHVAAH